jgi:AcrR family transcriptional regulator
MSTTTSSLLKSKPPRETSRDRRAKETRVALIRAAVELVHELGWKKTTASLIAERAGVAKGTFFLHFPTKESIVVAVVTKQIDAAHAARDAAMKRGDGPLERLREGLMILGELAAANLSLSRAVLVAGLESADVGSATDAVFYSYYVKMIEDASEAHATRQVDMDGETLAGLLMAGFLGATLHCTSTPRAKPLLSVLAPIIDATLANARSRSPDGRRGGGKS